MWLSLLSVSVNAPAQEQGVRLTAQDIADTISSYRLDPAQAVASFRRRMPAAVTDPAFRASIHQNLPTEFARLRLDDPALIDGVREVLRPVLTMYGRERVYDVVVIATPTPIMMSDSGVVLLVSTGMIERATSDDELLGYAAHEVAHEFYGRYSVYAAHLRRLVAEGGREPALLRHLAEMQAVIELQCDAFAALMLAALGRNPLAFVQGLELTARDFPRHAVGQHPADGQRRAVVEQVVPAAALRAHSGESAALKALKQRIIRRQSTTF